MRSIEPDDVLTLVVVVDVFIVGLFVVWGILKVWIYLHDEKEDE